jgi:hypothetical protein
MGLSINNTSSKRDSNMFFLQRLKKQDRRRARIENFIECAKTFKSLKKKLKMPSFMLTLHPEGWGLGLFL